MKIGFVKLFFCVCLINCFNPETETRIFPPDHKFKEYDDLKFEVVTPWLGESGAGKSRGDGIFIKDIETIKTPLVCEKLEKFAHYYLTNREFLSIDSFGLESIKDYKLAEICILSKLYKSGGKVFARIPVSPKPGNKAEFQIDSVILVKGTCSITQQGI